MKCFSIRTGLVLLAAAGMLFLGCFSVPHLFWPQKNVPFREIHTTDLETKVLVAPRQSAFKEAVAAKVAGFFEDRDVYVRIIGMDRLKKEDGSSYRAVVLMNTCMSWDMDRAVKSFLKKQKDPGRVIVLTTSGDGKWMPKPKDRAFDAIASASVDSRVDEVAQTIVQKVLDRIGPEEVR